MPSTDATSTIVYIPGGLQEALHRKERSTGVRMSSFIHIVIEEFFNGKMPAISFFSRMRRLSKRVLREKKRKRKMGEVSDQRQQVIFRLWPEDHAELRAYLQEKGITIQLFSETLVRAFLDGDPTIERLIDREKNRKLRSKKKKPRYTVDGIMDDIYEEVEEDG